MAPGVLFDPPGQPSPGNTTSVIDIPPPPTTKDASRILPAPVAVQLKNTNLRYIPPVPPSSASPFYRTLHACALAFFHSMDMLPTRSPGSATSPSSPTTPLSSPSNNSSALDVSSPSRINTDAILRTRTKDFVCVMGHDAFVKQNPQLQGEKGIKEFLGHLRRMTSNMKEWDGRVTEVLVDEVARRVVMRGTITLWVKKTRKDDSPHGNGSEMKTSPAKRGNAMTTSDLPHRIKVPVNTEGTNREDQNKAPKPVQTSNTEIKEAKERKSWKRRSLSFFKLSSDNLRSPALVEKPLNASANKPYLTCTPQLSRPPSSNKLKTMPSGDSQSRIPAKLGTGPPASHKATGIEKGGVEEDFVKIENDIVWFLDIEIGDDGVGRVSRSTEFVDAWASANVKRVMGGTLGGK